LIDQGFKDDGGHAGTLHVERVGSTRREERFYMTKKLY